VAHVRRREKCACDATIFNTIVYVFVDGMGSNTECIHCGATDDRDNGIVVGLVSDMNDTECNICRSDWLVNETPLTDREADVYALQELMGWDREQIAEFLGVETSTVGTLCSRIATRIKESVRLHQLTSN